jgi:hypothetical protein
VGRAFLPCQGVTRWFTLFRDPIGVYSQSSPGLAALRPRCSIQVDHFRRPQRSAASEPGGLHVNSRTAGGPRNRMAQIRRVPEGRTKASTPQDAWTSDRGTRNSLRMIHRLHHLTPSCVPPGRADPAERSHTGATGPRLRSWGPPGPKAVPCRVMGCTPSQRYAIQPGAAPRAAHGRARRSPTRRLPTMASLPRAASRWLRHLPGPRLFSVASPRLGAALINLRVYQSLAQ